MKESPTAMIASPQRPHEGPGRRAIGVSVGAHLLLVAGVWALSAFSPTPVVYETIAISLYSPPPASSAEEVQAPEPQEEELQVETPDPEPDPEDVPLPEVHEEVTAPPEPTVQESQPDPEPATEDRATVASEEPPSEETGEDLNVRMRGVQRDYPEYYNNILRQIGRCFRGARGQHRAVVKFTILRDGTVEDIDVVESSGSVAFEVRALEAVECAGSGRFGPLPSDIAYDELPILFSFDPRGRN